MDITSTAASTIQVNQKPTVPPKTNSVVSQPPPEDANIQAIQKEISQISDEIKNSKLQPLKQDTVDFTKSEKAQEINMTTPATPIEAAKDPTPTPEPVKGNTPAA